MLSSKASLMIEFEYWQLLLFPLFFGLGWAAARIDIRHLVKESRAAAFVFSGAQLLAQRAA
jgi:lipopolysaccharide biosynthesis regulator YciM